MLRLSRDAGYNGTIEELIVPVPTVEALLEFSQGTVKKLLADTVMDSVHISLEIGCQAVNPSELLECSLVSADHMGLMDKSL